MALGLLIIETSSRRSSIFQMIYNHFQPDRGALRLKSFSHSFSTTWLRYMLLKKDKERIAPVKVPLDLFLINRVLVGGAPI